MIRTLLYTVLIAAAGLAFVACGDDGSKPAATGTPAATSEPSGIDPADFQTAVDSPYYPLVPGSSWTYEGTETDPDTGETIEVRGEVRVLAETEVIAGVEVTVVQDQNFENGELVESTLDYFAQHVDGSVYYFGERVDDYEDGEIVGHGGQWLAGEDGALPGVFMPAQPAAGDEFEQERAPGVAEDQSRVLEADVAVSTPAGQFSGCIQTEDYDPIGDVTEHKFYCADVGFVREETAPEGRLDLVSYELA